MTQKAATKNDHSNDKSKSAAAVKERAAQTVEKSVEAAQDSMSQAADQAKQVTEQANAEISKLTEKGTDFVRQNPGAAVVGAVGVGLLLGLALRSRD